MPRPNLTSTKGVLGIAMLKRDLEKPEFVHTPSQSENFPYHKMKNGQCFGIRPNLSTLPLSYGVYDGDTFIFAVGSPLSENADFYFSTPPLMPKDDFDVSTQRNLTKLYLNQLVSQVLIVSKTQEEDEITVTIDLTDMVLAKILFRSLLVTGYLPTLVVEGENGKPVSLVMTFSLLNRNYIDNFLECYPYLPEEIFEDY